MLIPLAIVFIVNTVALVMIMLGLLLLVRRSIKYTRAIGDDVIQEPLKWRIIRLVMLMFLLALTLTIFNFIAGLG